MGWKAIRTESVAEHLLDPVPLVAARVASATSADSGRAVPSKPTIRPSRPVIGVALHSMSTR